MVKTLHATPCCALGVVFCNQTGALFHYRFCHGFCVCCLCLAVVQLPATLQYNINLPPLPLANNALAFVALRLATYPRDRQKCDLPRPLQETFEEVFAVQAQQFKGYLFQTHEAASREVCS